MRDRLEERIRRLKQETFALYLAARDPATPWYAKALVAAIVAYAVSPIDLIPDFIPVIGLLDDLVLLPLGIALAIRLIPDAVLARCRERAGEALAQGAAGGRAAAAVVVAIWIALALLAFAWWRDFRAPV